MSTVAPALTDEQLAEVLRQMAVADTVELKLTIPDSDIRSVSDALDLDPLEGEIRQILFFDTPDLTLYNIGTVVRARRIQGGLGDTVVKLRPIPEEMVTGEEAKPAGIGVEVDAMPGGFVCSASLKGKATAKQVRQVARGMTKIGSLFGKDQKALFHRHAPEDLKLGGLSLLGPINIFKLRFAPLDLGRKMVAELWLYPDGSRILELSTKCLPDEAFQVAAVTRSFLAGRGVDLTAEQQTKTKTALTYFSECLRAKAGSTKEEPAKV